MREKIFETSQIRNSINNVLSGKTDGLINLNDFIIYKHFHKDIMYNKLSKLNKCI